MCLTGWMISTFLDSETHFFVTLLISFWYMGKFSYPTGVLFMGTLQDGFYVNFCHMIALRIYFG